jgi:hypothetical protein
MINRATNVALLIKDVKMNNYFKLMLTGTALMLVSELIPMLIHFKNESVSTYIFAGLFDVFYFALLVILGRMTAQKPFPVGIIAISFLILVVILQLLLTSHSPAQFGFASTNFFSAIGFYLGASIYLIAASIPFIQTGMKHGWK